MYIDALVVGAVVAEWQASLVGGRIQQVVMPTAESIGLEVYAHGQRQHVLLSAHPAHARLHLVPSRLTRSTATESPLFLLLRKYVRGGRITRIECPPLERVVAFSITKMPAPRNQAAEGEENDGEQDEPLLEPLHSELIVEIIGRSSNIVLVDDDNLILDSVRRYTTGRSQRPIMPRHIYEAPHGQDKRDPRQATAQGIAGLEGPTLAKALVETYRGVSPQTGREVAFRAAGDANAPLSPELDAEAAAAALRLLAGGDERRPCLARDEDGRPLAVAPFWLNQFARVEEQPSVNAALAAAWAEIEQVTSHAQTRDALLAQVRELGRRAATKVDQLRTQLARAEQLERLRWEGEMIFAYLHAWQPGQRELAVEDQVIPLDPKLTGVENAQRRFREYDKAKGALEGVPELLAGAEAQAAYLGETASLLGLAEGFEEIAQFERELMEQGLIKTPQRKGKAKNTSAARKGPLKVVSPDGWTIYVGRSATQNDEVTFKIAQPGDYWLHARQRPGGHVIVRMQADELPPATLERAAQLAAYYSTGRQDQAVEVDLARRKIVRRIKGGPPGLVSYEPELTVRVAPRGA
ncbi:MAG TPA: NFACT RNA binding domain-containing protein [Herpetosiphonaceae bacterium]